MVLEADRLAAEASREVLGPIAHPVATYTVCRPASISVVEVPAAVLAHIGGERRARAAVGPGALYGRF